MSGEAAMATTPKQWYVVHTYSGFENKVAEAIQSRAKIFGMGEKITRVLVPTEKVVEVRNKQKRETSRSSSLLRAGRDGADGRDVAARAATRIHRFVAPEPAGGASPDQWPRCVRTWSCAENPLPIPCSSAGQGPRHRRTVRQLRHGGGLNPRADG